MAPALPFFRGRVTVRPRVPVRIGASVCLLFLLAVSGGCGRDPGHRLEVTPAGNSADLHRNRFGSWLAVIDRAEAGRVQFATSVDPEERFKLIPAPASERIGGYRVTGGRRELPAESVARFRAILLDPDAFEAGVPEAFPGDASIHIILDARESSIPVILDPGSGILMVGIAGIAPQPRFQVSRPGRERMAAVLDRELK